MSRVRCRFRLSTFPVSLLFLCLFVGELLVASTAAIAPPLLHRRLLSHEDDSNEEDVEEGLRADRNNQMEQQQKEQKELEQQLKQYSLLHPVNLSPPPRIVAMGDVHGDIENFRSALLHAELIDCGDKWIGDRAVFVQMGDVADRGPHGHTILELLKKWKKEARAQGGDVIQLLGNHEALNLAGDFRYTHKEQIRAFGGAQWLKDAMSVSGPYGAYLADLPAAVILHGNVFVHGGFTSQFGAYSVDKLNTLVREHIIREEWNKGVLGATGPLWSRQMIKDALNGSCTATYNALQLLSDAEVRRGRPPVYRIVVGHTILPSGKIMTLCNDTLLAVDICISQYFQHAMCGNIGYALLTLNTAKKSKRSPTVAYYDVFAGYPFNPRRHHSLLPVSRPRLLGLRAVYIGRLAHTHNLDVVLVVMIVAALVVWKLHRNRKIQMFKSAASGKKVPEKL